MKSAPGSWHVFHDVAELYGNWDHIAVGPGGVFLIDSKNLSERAVVDDAGLRTGSLRVGGGRSRGAAVRRKEAIARNSGHAVCVQSVVTVWGELDGGATERDNVIYVPGEQLAETLLAQRERLSVPVIEDVVQAVGELQSA